MNTHLTTIDLNPSEGSPDAAVIWLHGLGADGHDFVPIVERFKALQSQVRFVFPHAPMRAVTVNGGLRMRAWYDILGIDISAKEDSEGIQASAQSIDLLIKREEASGIASNRIVLGGFSQGGAMALYAGLRYQKPLGGIIALSSYLPLADTLVAERKLVNQNIPIFMAHGLWDTVVPIAFDQWSQEQLVHLGYQIQGFSYPMAHTVVPEELDDIDHFLQKVLLENADADLFGHR